MLELRARDQAGSAIRALLNLALKTARHLRDGTDDTETPLDRVKIRDRLRVPPGDGVPVDGVFINDNSAVDGSMVTGEPMPSPKGPLDKVIGGTVSGTGALVIRAEKIGSGTVLAHILATVAEAQRSRAPIHRIADTVAGYFVPLVLAFASIAFAVWAAWGLAPTFAYALIAAVSVVIIACPCALGLATPMSIMVGVAMGTGPEVAIQSAGVTLVKSDLAATARPRPQPRYHGQHPRKPNVCLSPQRNWHSSHAHYHSHEWVSAEPGHGPWHSPSWFSPPAPRHQTEKIMENVTEISKHHTTAASCCDSAAVHHKEAAKHLAAGNPEKAADHAVKADALVGEAIHHTAEANKQHPPTGNKSCCC